MKLTVRQIRDMERDVERLSVIVSEAKYEDSYDGSEAGNIVKRLRSFVDKLLCAEVEA